MNTLWNIEKWALRAAGSLIALGTVVCIASCGDPGGGKVVPPATTAGAAATREKLREPPPFTLGRETTFIDGPLKPDGSPDYVAAINQKQSKGVTPRNNGFVVWLEVVGDHVLADQTGTPGDARLREQSLALCGAPRTPAGAELLQPYWDFLKQRDPKGAGLDAPSQARLALWTPREHPDLADFLRHQEKHLDRAVDAAEMPRWWQPTVASEAGDWVSTPQNAQLLRAIGDYLCARSTLRAGHGDFAGFQRDALAVKRLARHVASQGRLTDLILGWSMNERADEAIGAVVGAGILSEKQCSDLHRQLTELPELPALDVCLSGPERFAQLETMLRFAKGNGEAMRETQMLEGVERNQVDWNTALRRANRLYDDVQRDIREPHLSAMQKRLKALKESIGRDTQWMSDGLNLDPEPMKFTPEQRDEITAKAFAELRQRLRRRPSESRDAYTDRVSSPLMLLNFPSFEGPEELRRRASMGSEMLAVLLAAAQTRAKTGAWPEKLEQMAPKMTTKVLPADIYAPQANCVQYRVANEMARVYSVGRNGCDDLGKRREEGGDDIVIGGAGPKR